MLTVALPGARWARPVGFSAEGDELVAKMGAGLALVDLQAGAIVRTYEKPPCCHAVVVSPDGHLLATAAGGAPIRLWDVKTGALAAAFPGHPHAEVTSLAFDPSGTRLASGADDGTILLWRVARP